VLVGSARRDRDHRDQRPVGKLTLLIEIAAKRPGTDGEDDVVQGAARDLPNRFDAIELE
jgi:hypothetical protein